MSSQSGVTGRQRRGRVDRTKKGNVCARKKLSYQREREMQWLGHARRELEGGVPKMMEGMEVLGKRTVGRPRITWIGTMQQDLRDVGS